jgi:WD40 repeat protein
MKYQNLLNIAVTLAICGCTIAAHAGPPQAKGKKPAAPPAKTAVKKATAPPAPKVLKPGPMWSVAYSPDGTTLVVGGYRKVFLFDAANGTKKAEYPVSSDAIRSLAFSRDGKLLAAATGVPGQSGSVIVLDAASGNQVRLIKGHNDTVEAVAFAGDMLLAAADDEKVSVTGVGDGKAVGSLAEHIGRCLAVAVPKDTNDADGGDIWATGGADSAVKIWDAKARRVVVNFDQCQGGVWCLSAGARPGMFFAGSGDGKIRMLRVRADGKANPAEPGAPSPRTGYLGRTYEGGHEGAVYAVATSVDGKRMVSGGADRLVNVWNVDGGRLKQFTEAGSDIWGVAISPDSKSVAAASLDGKTRVYDIEKGTLLFTVNEKGTAAPPAVAPTAPGTPTPAPGTPVKTPNPKKGMAAAAPLNSTPLTPIK